MIIYWKVNVVMKYVHNNIKIIYFIASERTNTFVTDTENH